MLDLDMGGEDEDPGFRELVTNLVRCIETFRRARRRHPDVDDHELGPLLAHELQELVPVACLADNLEAGPVEQARETLAQKDVVVRKNDSTAGIR